MATATKTAPKTTKTPRAKSPASKSPAKSTAPRKRAPKAAPAVIDVVAEGVVMHEQAASALAVVPAPVVVVELPATLSASEASNSARMPEGFVKRNVNGGQVMDCHMQWKNRPADEAVYSVDELLARTGSIRNSSRELPAIAWDDIRVEHNSAGDLLLAGNEMSNYALQQLCRLPSKSDGCIAPVDFVTRLSAPLAADVLNERLRAGVDRESDASLLVGPKQVRSIMTEAYTRVWDHEIAERIANLAARGGWGPAQAFKTANGTSDRAWGPAEHKLPLGWVGDRSMFVCLVDYEGSVTHEGNQYARFFLLSNSEVGAAALSVTFGLMDFACCNFILWGCHEVYDATFRHTASVRERWDAIGAGMAKSLASDTRSEILLGMDNARATLLGDTKERVLAVVQAQTELPKSLVVDAYGRAEGTPRYGDPRSVWGMLNGLTEASQVAAEHADKRVAIDAKAARLMQLVA